MWRTIGTTRSARGFLLHSAMSTTGRLGWKNPIAAPLAQLSRGVPISSLAREKNTPSNYWWGRICEADKDHRHGRRVEVRRQGFEPRTR